MMHHGKSSEFDFTSNSSPSYSNDSPKYPVYYVQSPSGYSQDDASRMHSAHASPTRNTTPTDSPVYSSTNGRSSNPRSSSASRISGNWRYLRINRKRADKVWESRVIHQRGVYDDHHEYADQWGGTLISPYSMAVAASLMAVVAFCLIIWGASRPYKAQISVQRLIVNNFYVGGGSDQTGVPTKLLTVNCTAIVSIHNPATFFGIYLTSDLVDLMYWEIRVASGELKRHYQPRTSSSTLTLDLDGSQVPLYGAGAALQQESRQLPLKLDMDIRSCGYLLGGLMKTKHRRRLSCSLVFDSLGTKDIIVHEHACKYD